jgi:pimeloyl-ACP methyl ester carboxylesterase
VRDDSITLRDRRTLAFTDLGSTDRRAPVVVYLHGAPTSRLDLVSADDAFAAAGVRVLCPDRPGYGGSSPHAARTMLDHANDVAALADRLGVGTFAAVGLSSGGPYSLACAAHLGRRVDLAVVIAGVTDFGWEGAWVDYLPDEQAIMRAPDEAAAQAWCETTYGADGMGFLSDGGPSPVDDDAPPATHSFFTSMIEAFRQGVGGYAQDVWVQGHAWPFDVRTITAATHVFHGDADPVVPIAHAEHTASIVPGARLEVWPGESHLGAAGRAPDVIIDLASA